jgi:hypothetical protein
LRGVEAGLKLPHDGRMSTAAAGSMERLLVTGQPGRRILIVDDDAGIRRSLQALLRKAGYEVMLAGDGSEAVRLPPGARIIAMSGGGQTKRLDLLGSAAARIGSGRSRSRLPWPR